MHTLPPELHDYICELACVDDGATIRSLNMVSSYMNQVSKPYLFSNVVASGIKQISYLSERLKGVPPHLRQIRRLFLSDSLACISTSTEPNFPSSPTNLENSTALIRHITSLIVLAAPTLKSFALVVQSPASVQIIARVFRTQFPVLQRLAISGLYPFPSSPGKFPRLEYLHLNGNRNPAGLLRMSALEDACPSLTTLRVSGLSSAGAFLIELEEALNVDHSGCDDGFLFLSSATLPPLLRRVVLQAGPSPDTAQGEITRMKNKVMYGRLERLKERAIENDRKVEVSVLARHSRTLSSDDIREEWIFGIAS